MRSKLKLLNQLRRQARFLLSLSALIISCTSFTSCTTVKPWQKGNFAKKHMQLDPNPMQSRFNRHIEQSREGSSGGYGVGGGGCGCG